jgi:hypothetical protein
LVISMAERAFGYGMPGDWPETCFEEITVMSHKPISRY